jgi:hypothetical protein
VKKLIIAALVGGLILFVWQMLSFMVLQLHSSQMQYTDKQDEILAAIEATGIDEGEYFLPNTPATPSEEDRQAFMDKYTGKPWANLTYHKELEMSMGMNMVRGFLIDFLAAFILSWLLLKFADLNMKTSIIACIGVGIIGYLTINYLDAVWYETNSWPDLIDAVVQWGLVGVWFGWYLKR